MATPSADAALQLARSRFPVLAGLSGELAARFVAECRVMKVARGTRLFDERSPCGAFPLLIEGRVKVAKLSPSGREIVLYRVDPGQSCLLTSSCLLARRDYAATGIAEAETTLVAIPRELFDALMAGDGAFRDYVHALFADRIGELMALVEEVAFRRLDQRLAAHLLAHGPQVSARHQDIAVELGSVREIVSRLLSDFEDRGLVALGRGRIDVTDRQGLEALAAGR
ncbi:MAG: Crp/Fnr family transcriptional regulator [Betaproteobacteria bacterium]|nr:Crp/Fnr family transcriptional regulator [Betaproteobacteria bacterium]PWB64109.1 MAG: transcriptional regulator [Betaproteobacteria bacterium]